MDQADPITEEALRFFGRPAGRLLLADASELLSGSEWQAQAALRRTYPVSLCRAAMALVQLRRSARGKFPLADAMFFDRAGLEMATRADVARYRASRLCGHGLVADLCCGIGGDLIELAQAGDAVGLDRQRRRARMARMNCDATGAQPRGVLAADMQQLRFEADVAFVDPARRTETGRQRRGAAYHPPLKAAIGLAEQFPAVAVKIAPGIDEAEIPHGWEVEFVSAGGQCREGVLYAKSLATARRRATIVPGGHSLVSSERPAAAVAPAGRYLYDPDPALVRAHLIDELAHLLDAWKLDDRVAYLSAEAHVPTPFARSFRVLSVEPFNVRHLRQVLLAQDMRPQEIKKRRFPMTPEEVRKRLGRWKDGHPVTLVLTRIYEKPVCLICDTVA